MMKKKKSLRKKTKDNDNETAETSLINREKREDSIPSSSSGDILNDKSSGTDYLGHNVYAEALARNIGEISTPMTVGMFGSWGSGKSFLLNKVKVLLDLKNLKQSQDNNDCCFNFGNKLSSVSTTTRRLISTSLLFVLFALGVIFTMTSSMCLFTNHNNNTNDVDNVASYNTTFQPIKQEEKCNYAVAIICIIILSLSILTIIVLACVSKACWSAECRTNFWIVLYAAFTKLPNKVYKRRKHQTRYIFVNFNAWQYAGSDILWAGIVTNLSNAIEDEFGSVTSRLFRMLSDIKIPYTMLFANFPQSKKVALENEMKGLGVNQSWERLKKLNQNVPDDEQSNEWWFVRFSTSKEVKQTSTLLEAQCIEFNFSGPTSPQDDDDENNNKPRKCKCINSFLKYPKTTCFIPDFLVWGLVVASAITVIVVVSRIADSVNIEVYKTGRQVQAVVQFLAWLPSSVVVLYTLFKIAWAMFHSQAKRITSTLEGTKGAMSKQLGIMDKIKEEVEYITELVKYAEVVHERRYKVVIFIDDLDRVALDKVKSVLESVNILLSDESSPFVCLIAVDSRVAVKSIEENKESGLQNSKISGHEYLKKIINLPFCLPEISEEKKESLVRGLIRQTNEVQAGSSPENEVEAGSSSGNTERNGTQQIDPLVEDYKINEQNKELNNQDFINECRKYFHSNESIRRYLHGNPRNIKRIFNVISLTSSLIQCYDEEETSSNQRGSTQNNSIPVKRSKNLAEDLVIWIILTDQWPCKMSCILHVIEDTDKENKAKKGSASIKDETSLLDIYKNYVLRKTTDLEKENLSSLDVHENAFQCFLKELGDSRINKKKTKVLKQLTINLDHCIRQTICQLLN